MPRHRGGRKPTGPEVVGVPGRDATRLGVVTLLRLIEPRSVRAGAWESDGRYENATRLGAVTVLRLIEPRSAGSRDEGSNVGFENMHRVRRVRPCCGS